MTESTSIALLGGSFDPPHLAHHEVIAHLLQQGSYDEVWVIPAKQNPLKTTQAPFTHRYEMCRLAFSDFGKKVRVLKDDESLSGYTIDLIRHLRAQHPTATFTFIGGSDLQRDLPKWKETEALQKLVTFEFLPRPPQANSPFSDISSTELRWRLKTGEGVSAWISEAVQGYIRRHHLYI